MKKNLKNTGLPKNGRDEWRFGSPSHRSIEREEMYAFKNKENEEMGIRFSSISSWNFDAKALLKVSIESTEATEETLFTPCTIWLNILSKAKILFFREITRTMVPKKLLLLIWWRHNVGLFFLWVNRKFGEIVLYEDSF